MKYSLPSLFLLIFIYANVFGQNQFQTTGNWNTSGNWSGSNIGDLVTENVTVANNINATVINGTSYTIGDLTFGNTNVLKVNSGGTLNVGDATHTRNLITGNNTTLNVAGTLVIWGDLEIDNNAAWTITGTVIIKGSVDLGNNATLSVSGGGTLQVAQDFDSGTNGAVSISSPSSISVGHNVDVGNNSSLTGCSGCFHAGGTCSGPNSFCSSNVLPITLLSFSGQATGSTISINWLTAREINVDHFSVQRMIGDKFLEIGTIAGHGNSDQVIEYSFDDVTPSAGSNYYRLLSIDYDGKTDVSNVIKVDITKDTEDKVTVYPNPVTGGTFDIVTNFTRQDGDRMLIYNNVGALIKDTNSLTSGIYTLYYISSDKRCVTRFVVR